MRHQKSLPTLNALAVFEAAARLGSLTRAAREFNIAQSAVSRHVANLESQLGVQLFKRSGNRIALNEVGIDLADSVNSALSAIRQAVDRLQAPDRKTLIVGCTYDLQQMWLMPRFDLLASRAPNGQVMVLTSYDYAEFDRPDVGLSFRFGKPEHWPGLQATKLFDGEWFPVCAPSFLTKYPFLAADAAQNFLRVPLLHLNAQPSEVNSWETWTGSHRPLEGPRFTNYLSLIHEAIAGRGAALAWVGFIEEHLRAGRLIRLGTRSTRHQSSYYVVTRKQPTETVRRVVDALLASVDA
ncbi:MAG: LysR family transcriptional regulator [Mesorhizobium sp.]|uniref:LysR family transcriptional regulator n=1 Tax=Mesorhizobium sp. TaxID=1871066 RepID=UPI000FE4B56A|nr:LysR family transcriptional regulator [Mesorhizobium sp.]RWE22864.1 MAG: LysR family transcriptional regulator [Mesorhizobium sp.]